MANFIQLKSMPIISQIYEKAKKKNIISGIIIGDLITFIAYLLFPSGLVFFGDLQMIIGSIVGTLFSLKNIKSYQSYLKHGIIVGLVGTILSAISMSIVEIIVYPTNFAIVNIELFLIEGFLLGLIIGGIIGSYYRYKNKAPTKTSSIEDDFYESLKEK